MELVTVSSGIGLPGSGVLNAGGIVVRSRDGLKPLAGGRDASAERRVVLF